MELKKTLVMLVCIFLKYEKQNLFASNHLLEVSKNSMV